MTAVVAGVHLLFELYFDGDELAFGTRSADGELWQRVAEGKRRD